MGYVYASHKEKVINIVFFACQFYGITVGDSGYHFLDVVIDHDSLWGYVYRRGQTVATVPESDENVMKEELTMLMDRVYERVMGEALGKRFEATVLDSDPIGARVQLSAQLDNGELFWSKRTEIRNAVLQIGLEISELYLHGLVYKNGEVAPWKNAYNDPEGPTSQVLHEQLKETLSRAIQGTPNIPDSAVGHVELLDVNSIVGAQVVVTVDEDKYPWESTEEVLLQMNRSIFSFDPISVRIHGVTGHQFQLLVEKVLCVQSESGVSIPVRFLVSARSPSILGLRAMWLLEGSITLHTNNDMPITSHFQHLIAQCSDDLGGMKSDTEFALFDFDSYSEYYNHPVEGVHELEQPVCSPISEHLLG
ncbi:unnamed protein product [Echinostoma caproni]|uniref:Tudor domain-containing protein n=1 Tax=Echinostoma caproni TaxID=27848 RepID=A0A183AKC0_9TREM|nr:unnamed protein product [Echinostoma caproni]